MAQEINIAAPVLNPAGPRGGPGAGPRNLPGPQGGPGAGQAFKVNPGSPAAKQREAIKDKVNAAPAEKHHELVKRSEAKHAAAIRQHESKLHALNKTIEGGKVPAAKIAKAKAVRRQHAAKVVASHVRHRRLRIAHHLFVEAKKSADPKVQFALREAAKKVLHARIRFAAGKAHVECGGVNGFDGFDGYPAGAADQFGARVPQWASGIVPTQNPDLIRAMLTQAGAPAAIRGLPAPILLPNTIALPGVAQAQPQLPAFYPEPPRSLPIGIPGRAPARPLVLIPAAQRHPARRLIVARPPGAMPPRQRNILPPAPPAARVLGPDVVVAAPPPPPRHPPRAFRPMPFLAGADMGLGQDVIVADIAGLDGFLDALENAGDLAEMGGYDALSDLGAEPFVKFNLPKIKLFPLRLDLHKSRLLESVTGGVLGFIVGVGSLPLTVVGAIVGAIAGDQVNDEASVADKIGRKADSAAKRKRLAALTARWRSARNPCAQ